MPGDPFADYVAQTMAATGFVAYILAGLVLGPGVARVFIPGTGPAIVGELGILLLVRNAWSIFGVTATVLAMNSFLSVLVFRFLGMPWRDSWSAGALLSQTGELGLLACSMAVASGMIDEGLYKLCVAVTGLTLLLSTAWTSVLRRIRQDK